MLKLFALALLLATISAQENGADDILNDIASAANFDSDLSVNENERWGAPAPAPAPAVAPGEAPVPAHKGNWHALAKKGAGWWGKHAHASAPGFDGKNHGAGWWGKHVATAPAPAPKRRRCPKCPRGCHRRRHRKGDEVDVAELVDVDENERWGAPAPAPAPAAASGEAPVPAHKGNWHALAKKGTGWWGKHAHASAPGSDGKNHGAGWWGKHAKNATGNAPAPAPAPGKGHRGRWAFLHGGCPHCRCPKPGVFQRKVRWGMKPPSGKLRGSGSAGNGGSTYGGRRGSGSSGSRGSGSGSGGYGGRRGSGGSGGSGSGPASSGSGFFGSGSGSGPASSGSGFFSSGSGNVEGGSGSGGSGSGSGPGGVLKKTKGGVAWTIPGEQNIQESDDADVEADLDIDNGFGLFKRRRRVKKHAKKVMNYAKKHAKYAKKYAKKHAKKMMKYAKKHAKYAKKYAKKHAKNMKKIMKHYGQ